MWLREKIFHDIVAIYQIGCKLLMWMGGCLQHRLLKWVYLKAVFLVLYFFIYINDFYKSLEEDVAALLFADDTTLQITSTNPP